MGNRVSAGIPLFCDDGSMVIEPTGRISAVGGGGGGPPTGPASGDLGGVYPGPQVVALQTVPVSAVAPTAGQFLGYNGVSWIGTTVVIPSSLPPSGPATGDLSGSYPGPIVDGLQGRPVAATAPASGEVLGWDGAQWEPTAFSLGGVLAATPSTVPLRTAAGGIRVNAVSADVGDLNVGFTSPAAAAPGDGNNGVFTGQSANTAGNGGEWVFISGDAASPSAAPQIGGGFLVVLGAGAGTAPIGATFRVLTSTGALVLAGGVRGVGSAVQSQDAIIGGDLVPEADNTGAVGGTDLRFAAVHAVSVVAHADNTNSVKTAYGATSQLSTTTAGGAEGPYVRTARDVLEDNNWRLTNTAATFGVTSTIDWDAGNVQTLILAGNTTIAFANPRDGGLYVLYLQQDATGGRQVTWPTPLTFFAANNGALPNLSRNGNFVDVFVFQMRDGTLICVSQQIGSGQALGYQPNPGNPFAGGSAITARANDMLRGDPTGGATTVTLPNASLLSVNHAVSWKSTTTSVDPVTFSVAGGGTIDNSATYAGITPRGGYTFTPVGNGTNAWDAWPPL